MTRTLVASVILLSACATDDPGELALAAVDDALAVEMNSPATLAIADNDDGVDDARTIEIIADAEHGIATLDDAGVLHYEPEAEYLGADELRYVISNPDGTSAEATVAITVGCETCAIGAPIKLSWDPNVPEEMVLGYRVYLGGSEDPEAMIMVDDVGVDAPGYDPAMPGATYDAWGDFRLRLGDTACFRLTAYNIAGESGFSNAACKVVDGAAMRVGL